MLGIMDKHGYCKSDICLFDRYPFFSWDEKVIRPLLEAQSYVRSVAMTSGPEDIDGNVWWLDDFRAGRMKPDWSIPRFVCDHFKLPYSILDEPWLKVTPNKKARYVFAKNTQDVCDNPKMDWKGLVERYGPESIFVGWGNEAAIFSDRFGRVPHYPTNDLLGCAELIAGAERIFCGQSVLHAIAESLKKDIMLECSPTFPSVIFNRPGVVNIL